MGEWYSVDAEWDSLGYAEQKLMALGQTREWLELVEEVALHTRATADEAWNGIADAVRSYLNSLGSGDSVPRSEYEQLEAEFRRVSRENEYLVGKVSRAKQDLR